VKTVVRYQGCVLTMLALLATSSVGSAGCKKKEEPRSDLESERTPPRAASTPTPTPTGSPTSNVVYRDRDGCRMRTPHFRGHEGPAWNIYEADCPAELLDAGEAPSTAKRPAGKEDWIRLKSKLVYEPIHNGCSFDPEQFCTPADRKGECSPRVEPTRVACAYDEKGGKMTFESFVYTGPFNTCHRIPKGECKIGPRGGCDLPSGDVVPCPAPSGPQ
jgi:hypothetical protein